MLHKDMLESKQLKCEQFLPRQDTKALGKFLLLFLESLIWTSLHLSSIMSD